MRQVTAEGPQRSTVSTRSSSSSGRKGRGPQAGEGRTFSAWIVAAAFVVGVVLGLVLAGIISLFTGGDTASGSRTTTPGASATPSEITDRQRQHLEEIKRRDARRANEVAEDRDVRISGCGTDSDGYASAQVLISNGTTKTATYHVRVIFSSAADGGIVSDDVATARKLAPGTSAPIQTVHSADPAPPEGVVCRLGSVSRF
jgi:hypothetical protein